MHTCMGDCTVYWQTTSSHTCSCKEICLGPLVQGHVMFFSGSNRFALSYQTPGLFPGLQQLISLAFDANLTARGSHFSPSQSRRVEYECILLSERDFQTGGWELFTSEIPCFTLCNWTALSINIYKRLVSLSSSAAKLSLRYGVKTFRTEYSGFSLFFFFGFVLLRCFKN